jgi:hypothetical protein
LTVHPADGDSAAFDEIEWDEVVDVICVGSGDTATALALAAEDAGLDVHLAVRAPALAAEHTLAGRIGLTDGPTVEYLTAVTDDTGPLADSDAPAELPGHLDAAPWAPPYHFSGARLREWASACLASPYGVLSTTPAEPTAAPSIVGAIDTPDAHDWLVDRAAATGLPTASDSVLQRLVFSGVRVVGAVLDTASGPYLVRATRAVLLTTGTGASLPALPAGRGTLAVVTHPVSRFARLALL